MVRAGKGISPLYVELATPDDITSCREGYFRSWPGREDNAAGLTDLVWVLDAEGQRITFDLSYPPSTTPERPCRLPVAAGWSWGYRQGGRPGTMAVRAAGAEDDVGDVRRSTAGSRSGAPLMGAVTTLVGLDVVGGVVAIRDGVNEPREAWGSAARLAAPWPMIALQLWLTTVAVRARRGRARGASVLLAVACLVSAVSGFFDGGFRDGRLTHRHRVLQAVLVLWTAVVGVLAADQAHRLDGFDTHEAS